MTKPFIAELERLIKLYEDHDNTFEEMLSRKLENDRWLEWFDEQAKRKLDVGKEFCNVTKYRNSMDVANLISIQMAKKLVDDVKSGRYY